VTTTVNESIARSLSGLRYDSLTLTAGLAVVVALVVLLLIKEVRRLRGGESPSGTLGLFDPYLVPLAITFGIIVAARLRELL
jgi:hypothetical protein